MTNVNTRTLHTARFRVGATAIAVAAATLMLGSLQTTAAHAAETRTVCATGCDFTDIQSAVDGSAAGDTITVGAGTYEGQVVLDKPLSLIGAGPGESILSGVRGTATLAQNTVVDIGTSAWVEDTSHETRVEGFTIRDGDLVQDDQALLLMVRDTLSANERVVIQGNEFIAGVAPEPGVAAIYSNGPATTQIENNTFTGFWQGVLLEKSGPSVISGNTFDGLEALPDPYNYNPIGVYILATSADYQNDFTVSNNAFNNYNGYGVTVSAGYAQGACTDEPCAGKLGEISITENTFAMSGVSPTPGAAIAVRTVNAGDAASINISDNSGFIHAPSQAIKIDEAAGSSLSVTQSNNTISAMALATPENPVVTPPADGAPVVVEVAEGTEGARIDFSSLLDGSGESATLPETTIKVNASGATLQIPDGTVVTVASGEWDGVLSAPAIRSADSVTLPAEIGGDSEVSLVLDVGAPGVDLVFDKAIRLSLPGQAGQSVAFIDASGDFTAIDTECTADTQTAGDSLAVGAECAMSVGDDLIVWTKHLTTFVAYAEVQSGGGINDGTAGTSGTAGVDRLSNTGGGTVASLGLGAIAMMFVGAAALSISRKRRNA